MSTPQELLDQAVVLIRQAQVMLPPTGLITDRIPRPIPAAIPQFTAAGSSIVDPTFGTKITRLTDGLMGGGSWRVASNTHLAGFSADEKACFVLGSGGQTRVFYDSGASWSIYWEPYSQCEPCFSRVDPKVLYTLGGPKGRTIRVANILTDQITDYLDLDTVVMGSDDPMRTYCGGVLSAANRVVTFFGGTGADRHHYVAVIEGGIVKKFLDTSLKGYLLHSISADLTGRYVGLYPTGAQPYQVIIWDTQLDILMPITPAMLPSGHDCLGYSQLINMDDGSAPWDAAEWQIRELNDLEHPRDVLRQELLPQEIQLIDHSSWNNAKPTSQEPFFSSLYRGTGNTTPWRAWDDEIVRITTDGTGVVARLAHHRSDMSAGFWGQPILNVAPSGKKLIFTSNWSRSLGVDAQGQPRQDVFMLEVP